ncbi:metallophosphoesterase [Clostridium chromiireducens]|uniref:Metallophosphoesterase n=1 Tax=Clostridium chromiireducens TaxID=225345 RepID=A0A964RMZ0_9CLOT|nr:metallophosphoesterase [Clostridium chromiireducens]MVX64607.1 metallophosphoesterase [Clostridium chromiireducens]
MIKHLSILLGFSLLSSAVYLDNKLLKVTKYNIRSEKIPKEFNEFKIIHLSDFHNYVFNKENTMVIKKISIENPDIIVMTGDMVNKYDTKFNQFLELVRKLSQRYKIYYIIGNHEKKLKKDDLDLIINELNLSNVNVINNNSKVIISRRNKVINIYGLDIPLEFYKVRNRPTNITTVVDAVLNRCNMDEYNILLTHNPLFFETYSKHNVDLILAGHVHGGMIRIPFIGGVLSPERKFFPKYSGGLYEISKKKLIVSKGIGHSKPGVRVCNMPEIVSITLLNS